MTTEQQSAASDAPESQQTRQTFLQINRNFMNYPLSRDSRACMTWRRSKKTGRWFSNLPGEQRITLFLPKDADRQLQRAPNAFDMNVLFELLRRFRVQVRQPSPQYLHTWQDPQARTIFCSHTALLATIAVADNGLNRRKLKQSLAFWSAVHLHIGCWRDPNRTVTYFDTSTTEIEPGRGRMRMKLPPVIVSMRRRKRTLRIRLSWRWCKQFVRYFERVRLPLPQRSAAQNLVLWIMTARRWKDREDRKASKTSFTEQKTIRQLCHIIGVHHGARHAALKRAFQGARAYFARFRGRLEMVTRNQDVGFIVKNPIRQSKPKPMVRERLEEPEIERERLPPDFDEFKAIVRQMQQKRCKCSMIDRSRLQCGPIPTPMRTASARKFRRKHIVRAGQPWVRGKTL